MCHVLVQTSGDYFFFPALIFAHRAFCASEIFRRAAALMLFPLRDCLLLMDAATLTCGELAFTLAHRAFCAIEIFLRAAALSRMPRRDDAGATATLLPPFSPANAVRAASTCRSWLVKFVFSARSSTTIASTPVIFAMAGIIAEVLSTFNTTGGVHSS
jgi:hypothetical protein